MFGGSGVAGAECSSLVGGCVCAQHIERVHVVGVGGTTARVIGRKAQGIEICLSTDDGVACNVIVEDGRRERLFNQAPGDAYRVVWMVVEAAIKQLEDSRSHIGARVKRMGN